MKRIFLFLFVCLVFCSQVNIPKYKKMSLPNPLPSELRDIIRLDTILFRPWFIPNHADSVLYPTMVGYKRVYSERSILTALPVDSVLKDAELFFTIFPFAPYYDNYYIRVFVSRMKYSDYIK